MKTKEQKNTIQSFGIETYGKQNIIKRMYNKVKWRFKVSRHTKDLLHTNEMTYYIPKLNKFRFSLAILASVVLIALPGVTLAAIPTILWGIR